ncbi:MAG: hypothetical protein K0S60_52 [Evtepia sp.]|nr:hypothetical protein [Evtepia sp.]
MGKNKRKEKTTVLADVSQQNTGHNVKKEALGTNTKR